MREAEAAINRAADGTLTVAKVVKKQRQRHPAAPFTTSTLQQEAARKLRFSARRTMSTAQRLYEDGLITYMRTDSVTLAGGAIAELRIADSGALRRREPAEEPASVQDQGEERSGSSRGSAADIRRPASG